MNADILGKTIAAANECASTSRRPGGLTLSLGSSRETLIAWLVWADPNGRWTDEDNDRDGWEPMTIGEAWEAIAETRGLRLAVFWYHRSRRTA